jgi:hypothetical protein
MSDPDVHGEVQVLVGFEHFGKGQIGLVGILNAATGKKTSS